MRAGNHALMPRRKAGTAFRRRVGAGGATCRLRPCAWETSPTPTRSVGASHSTAIRVLAAEQMQALPYATQLLARLGAEVVKVEHPLHGESGARSTPAMLDPSGRAVGATYLRNNLGKRSVGIDLKTPRGASCSWPWCRASTSIAENFKAGTMDRLGLGYEVIAAAQPTLDLRVDLGVRQHRRHARTATGPRTHRSSEAMSGIYEYKSGPDRPPVTIPVGALGDISSALFAVIGVLAALRHRDRTGEGQYVDIAMLDAMVAMTDVVTNFWSLGVRPEPEQGARGDLRGLPRVRRVRGDADRPGAPVRTARRSGRCAPSGRTIPRFATAPAGRRCSRA